MDLIFCTIRIFASQPVIDVNNFQNNEFRDHRRLANFCYFFRNGSYERAIGLQTAVARSFSW